MATFRVLDKNFVTLEIILANYYPIVQVQLAYVLQKQGKEKEAQNIYNSVLKSRPDDIGLVAVASNNLLAINRLDPNIDYLFNRKIIAWGVEAYVDTFLTSFQNYNYNKYFHEFSVTGTRTFLTARKESRQQLLKVKLKSNFDYQHAGD